MNLIEALQTGKRIRVVGSGADYEYPRDIEYLTLRESLEEEYEVEPEAYSLTEAQLVLLWNMSLPEAGRSNPDNMAPNSQRWQRFISAVRQGQS